jgi:hypothetical protein
MKERDRCYSFVLSWTPRETRKVYENEGDVLFFCCVPDTTRDEVYKNPFFSFSFQLMARDEREQEEREEREREWWNRRSHVLPLNMAATEELFNRYWPPPPPEPEPEPEPEPKAKPKKGKK